MGLGAFSALGGSVRAEACCPRPERFLRVCAEERIALANACRTGEDTLEADLSAAAFRRACSAAERSGIRLRAKKKLGPAAVMPVLKKRLLLLLLPLSLLASVWASELYVWEITVEGCGAAKATEVLSVLGGMGLRIGANRMKLSSETLSNESLQQLAGLSYLAVNFTGSRAAVLVREETKAPELPDFGAAAEVTASQDGVIARITALEGAPAAAVGDTVRKGQVLVPAEASSLTSGVRYVRADARIEAYTLRQLTAVMPLGRWDKTYTGEKRVKYALLLWGRRINLHFSSSNSWPCCDKITEKKTLTLLGRTLPLALLRETEEAYVLTGAEAGAAEALLKSRLRDRLTQQLENGRVLSETFIVQRTENAVTVTLRAECLEEIAQQRELPEIRLTDEKAERK